MPPINMKFIKTLKFSLIILAGTFALCGQANATWSIVAVDPETREVGLVAATCNSAIQFIAEVVPGAGVVAAQAETSFKGRDRARDWMTEGVGAEEVLKRLNDPALYDGWFGSKFPDLQYGVATLDTAANEKPAAGFVGGDNLVPWSGGKAGETWSVQGNTLRGKATISAAAAAFEIEENDTCRFTLGERLLRALEAGRDAGGDKRCPVATPAQSAILLLAKPEDGKDPSFHLVAPRKISLARATWRMVMGWEPDPDAKEPVAHLREKFVKAGGQTCR